MRSRQSAVLALIGVLALSACSPAEPAAPLPPMHPKPGASSAGDPYFPDDGNGGYDALDYHVDVSYDPPSGRLRRRHHGLRESHPRPQPLRSRPARAGRLGSGDRRETGEVQPGEEQAGRDSGRTAALGFDVPDARALFGCSGENPARRRIGERLGPLRGRRRVPGRRAAFGVVLVPGQRNPARQSDLHADRARAHRLDGHVQRPGAGHQRQGRQNHHDVGGSESGGQLPDHDRDRQVHRAAVHAPGRHADRFRLRAGSRSARGHRRPAAGSDLVPGEQVRQIPAERGRMGSTSTRTSTSPWKRRPVPLMRNGRKS